MKKVLCLTSALLLALVVAPLTRAETKPPPPDFTKGDKPGKAHDWTLGPTGARGWISTANGHSRDARQILVTAVAKDSPADGVLLAGDVLLGTGGKPFAGDARIDFARAITAAEARDGLLELLRWRDGHTTPVTVRLSVLGVYSDTAPYACAKSRLIFERGCAALAKRMEDVESYTKRLDPIPRAFNALALLASGESGYLPLVRREAAWASEFTTNGYLSWYYGFVMILVAEYTMTTGDQTYLPGLRRLALETARGQSGVGTWGHRFALPGGNLGGYGAMNAPGLPLTVGMVLAREAGVQAPELDQAIAKSALFLRWYLHKGAVPYGDHLPFPAHEDNGKCAAAAVLFDLLGDAEASAFFGRMTTAAYSERERGHTGNYFNILWAMQGVARCGPLATGAYWKEQSWYYDLARAWDMSWRYQGSPEGEEENNNYTLWDCSGSYLLDLALPRKSLRLTGRKSFTPPPLDAVQTAGVIAAGRDYAYRGDEDPYLKRTDARLLEGLSSWSPFVRKRSAAALAKSEGDHLPELLKMLQGADRDARYGALEALGALGPRADVAAPELRAALRDPDPWVQCLAAEAIPALGPEARKAGVSALLALSLAHNPADPRRLTSRSASIALFSNYPGKRGPRSLLADTLEGVDRNLFYPAVRALLQHEDSIPRGAVGKAFPQLTDTDLVELLPDIAKAIGLIAPSNEMFADGVRLAGLDLLSRLHIQEGMELCLEVLEPDRWGEKNRSRECLKYLQRYGAHAREQLPGLRQTRQYLAAVKKANAEQLDEFDKAITAIEGSNHAPTLVRLVDFKTRAAR